MLPLPDFIKRAQSWLAGSGWAYVGNETKEEMVILETAYARTVEWFAAMLQGMEPRWLTFVGPSGLGKTLLAKRVAAYVWEHGRALYERTVLQVIEPNPMRRRLEQSYSYNQEGHPFKTWDLLVPHNNDNRERLERARKNWFSVIDEIKPQTGDERQVEVGGKLVTAVIPKRFEVGAMDDLANHRLRKWTILTANLNRSQIAASWDVRIASRLTRDGNVLVDLSGVRDFGLRLEALGKSPSSKLTK